MREVLQGLRAVRSAEPAVLQRQQTQAGVLGLLGQGVSLGEYVFVVRISYQHLVKNACG